MKASVIRGNPYFTEFSSLLTVYIDGKRTLNCVTANEEEGWVDEYDRHFELVRRKGIIKIEMPSTLEYRGGKIVLAKP